jgi:hypothetical protein
MALLYKRKVQMQTTRQFIYSLSPAFALSGVDDNATYTLAVDAGATGQASRIFTNSVGNGISYLLTSGTGTEILITGATAAIRLRLCRCLAGSPVMVSFH